ncbi:MAG: HD domain-containing protein [bacterium]|nr:HD domain-containing protein [bacterium]MDD5354295.1 HD domain-containing protein [bacterium]MDD5756685.1 HD domain-containing protein [bacterium]
MLNNIENIQDKLMRDIFARFVIFFFGLFSILLQKALGLPSKISFIYIVLLVIITVNLLVFYLVKKNRVSYISEYFISLIDFMMINYAIWSSGGLESRLWFILIIVILIESISLNRSHLLFNLILAFITYPTIIYFYQQGVFVPKELNLLISRMFYMALVGLISLIYIKNIIKQQAETDKLNSDNIRLNTKLEEFSQVLSDEVYKATDDLKDKIREIERLYKKFRNLFIDFARALSAAVDARDPYTHGHSERVTKITFTILEELQQFYGEMDISEEVKETLLIAALLHDIGKLSLPDNILQKPGPLSQEEWVVMRKHPVIGQNIIKPIQDLRAAGTIIRSHHERFDGKGYPDNLSGDDIPFLSRVICVADSFDAMTSDRPYRPRMKTEEAIAEVKRCENAQFDPAVVKAFLAAYKKGTLFVID